MRYISFFLMASFLNVALATSIVKDCPLPEAPFDVEASKAIYFETRKHESFRTVVAHVPLPKRYADVRPQYVFLALLKPSITKKPLIQLNPEFEYKNHEIIIRFQGPMESDFEARVSLTLDGGNIDECRNSLTSTYRFIDSTYGFKSVFD